MGWRADPHGFERSPEPLRTELWDRVKEFAGQPMCNYVQTHMGTAMKAADERLRWWLRRDPEDPTSWLVSFHVGNPFPPPRGGKRWHQFPEGDSPRLMAPGWERFATHRVEPRPVAACEGQVDVQVLIATDGRVADTYVEEGQMALQEAAIEAARQWTFRTYSQADHAFEVQTMLRFEFGAPTAPTNAPSGK